MLNKDQQAFFDEVEQRVDVNQPGMMLLSASGGSGKTFLIKYIIKNIWCPITCLAPTHKAASLIQYGKTIHRYFNCKMAYDENGNQTFKFAQRAMTDARYEVLVVDECSMICDEMFAQFEIVARSKLVIFAGDMAQLPPVGYRVSPVFERVSDVFSLTRNMRNSLAPCASLIAQFRRNAIIEHSGVGVPKRITYNSIYEDYMLSCFLGEIDGIEQKDCVILTYTNRARNAWCAKVRNALFGKNGSPADMLCLGETMIFTGYRNPSMEQRNLYKIVSPDCLCQTRKCKCGRIVRRQFMKIAEDLEDIIPRSRKIPDDHAYHTSDMIHVQNIEQRTVVLNYFRCSCPGQNQDLSEEIVACPAHRIPHRRSVTSREIAFYEIIDQHGVGWLTPCSESRKHLKDILKSYKDICIQAKNSKLWSAYFAIEQLVMPEWAFSYSSTVHKAQGSEWKCVFVDLRNIRKGGANAQNPEKIMQRLAYTAVSRTTHNLHFINWNAQSSASNAS